MLEVFQIWEGGAQVIKSTAIPLSSNAPFLLEKMTTFHHIYEKFKIY